MSIEVNSQNFDQLTSSDKPCLIDFWAEWCGPCRMLSPIINELSEELADKITICKCNVDDNMSIAEKFKVMSIPTLIIFHKGKLVDQHIGGSSKNALKEWIESNI